MRSGCPKISPSLLWLSIGLLMLTLGLVFYLFARPAGTVYGLPDWFQILPLAGLPFADSLPTFLHCYSFILLSAAIVGLNTVSAGKLALLWFSFETFFEVAQLQTVAVFIDKLWPVYLEQFFLLDNVVPYFRNGQFDWFDLLSLALASLTAYATLTFSSGYLNRNVHTIEN